MSRPRSLPAALKKYSISSAFGPRDLAGSTDHLGADWRTPVGIPLEATIDGTVSAVGGSETHGWGYFLHIRCRCPLKHEVEYHIMRDDPRKRWKVGDSVSVGDLIGHTGSSGSLRGKRYFPHHHHGCSELNARGIRKHYDPLTIGWPATAANTATPIKEDELSDKAEEQIDAIWKWIRGDGPDAEGTMLYQIRKDARETVEGIRDLNVPDTRNRLGNIQYALGLLLGREGKASELVSEFTDAELKAIAVTVNDERDRRERERLGA